MALSLDECRLCQGISTQDLAILTRNVSLRSKSYARGEIIAFEGDECSSLGVVVSGAVMVERLLSSGKRVVIDRLQEGDSFGEVIIFSDVQTYPASIVVDDFAQITFISKEGVLRMCMQSQPFLNNFMSLLSNKIVMLNRKVKSLSYTSLRQKIAHYILQKYGEQGHLLLRIGESRREMADHLGLPRPSLSRELAAMKAEGWIDFDRDTIQILILERLEDCVM